MYKVQRTYIQTKNIVHVSSQLEMVILALYISVYIFKYINDYHNMISINASFHIRYLITFSLYLSNFELWYIYEYLTPRH